MSHRFYNCVLALASVLFVLAGSVTSALAVEPPMTAVAFAADGKRVVVGSQAGAVV